MPSRPHLPFSPSRVPPAVSCSVTSRWPCHVDWVPSEANAEPRVQVPAVYLGSGPRKLSEGCGDVEGGGGKERACTCRFSRWAADVQSHWDVGETLQTTLAEDPRGAVQNTGPMPGPAGPGSSFSKSHLQLSAPRTINSTAPCKGPRVLEETLSSRVSRARSGRCRQAWGRPRRGGVARHQRHLLHPLPPEVLGLHLTELTWVIGPSLHPTP